MYHKLCKTFFLSLPIVLVLTLLLAIGHVSGQGPQPPSPNVIPAVISVSPHSQSAVSSNNYLARWTVSISGEGSTYTLYVTFGDGGYLNRPGVQPGTYHYNWYYDNVSPGTYYQTWTINGVGGPDQDNSTVYRQP